ncbi:TetR/AcrR family transcriptional regulator [Nocardia xishanensis]|uniref:TetR/AcrR family transcriptional regulator n=1 Tax=Nocardia xishanensis TaxID=238964 RepID=UPI0033C75722
MASNPTSTSDRPRRRSPGNRPSDDTLLDAACAVFHATGFAAAGMDAIAAAADTTKPTLYAHFGSKDGVYQACLRREAAKFRAALFETYDSAAALNLRQEVRTDMTVFYEYAAAHPIGFGLLFDEGRSEPNAEVCGELVDSLTERIAHRIRTYAATHRHLEPSRSAELLAAMLVGIAVHGARQSLRLGTDMIAAGELAAAMANAALFHLDPQVFEAADSSGGRGETRPES